MSDKRAGRRLDELKAFKENVTLGFCCVCRLGLLSCVIGERPYDVQLVGGMVLHEGNVADENFGEGKTLVATLPTYLNALRAGRSRGDG